MPSNSEFFTAGGYMKKFTKILIPIILCATFVSCNWQLPQTLSVKTSAEYRLSLGSPSFDLTEYINSEKLTQKLNESMGSTVKLYDLQRTGDETLTYLIHYPVYSVPLDMSQYLDSLNVDSLLNSSSLSDVNQTIEIPSLSVNQTIEKSIKELLEPVISGSQSETEALSFPAVETGSSGYQEGEKSSILESHHAKGVKYKDGSKIVVNVKRSDLNALSSDFVMKIKAEISETTVDGYTYEGFTGDWVDVTDGGTIEIPLDRGYIPYELPVKIHYSYGGGKELTSFYAHLYNATFALVDSEIIEIAEINLEGDGSSDDEITLPETALDETTISVGDLPDLFIDATVGAGSAALKLECPAGWTGVSLELASLSIEGLGLSLDETDFVDDTTATGYLINKTADLSGVTISSGAGSEIKVNASIKVTCDGATLKFTDDDVLKTSVAVNVGSFSEVNLDLASLSYHLDDESAEVPASAADYVKKITFQDSSNPGKKHKSESELVDGDGFGVKCKIVNSLPAGNSIPVKISSGSTTSGLVFDSFTTELTANGNSDEQEQKLNAYPDVEIKEGRIYLNFDFGSEKIINGTTYENCVTLKNIASGSTYELKISDITLLCDWEKIELSIDDAVKVDGNVDLSSFDLNSMLENLPISADDVKKLSIGSVNTYFYAQKPENETLSTLLGDLSLAGTMKASYTDKDSVEQNKTILSDDTSISFKTPLIFPEGTTLTTEENSDFIARLSENDASFYTDLSEIINDFPSALKLDYEFNLQTANSSKNINIYGYQVDSLAASDTSTISVDLLCELPFDFALDGKISMNIREMMQNSSDSSSEDSESSSSTEKTDQEKDLFNRSGETTTEGYYSLAESIDSFKLYYKLDVKLLDVDDGLDALNANVTLNDSVSGLNKVLKIDGKSNELDFTGEEMKKVLKTYPFDPDILVNVGTDDAKTSFRVNREGFNSSDSLKCRLDVGLKMNGENAIKVFDSTPQTVE